MKALLLGMFVTYAGLVYAGKVEAPELPKALKEQMVKAGKRSPAAASAGPSTLAVTGSVAVGSDAVIKVQDSANGAVCYFLMGQAQQASSLQCLGSKSF